MRKGLSLIELLIALSLLGGILVLTNNLIFQNQTIASRQLLQRQASEDARMTMLRLSEVLSQASFIYPLDQTLQLPGGITQTTGASVLAALVASGTPYCPTSVSPASTYCAYMYRLEARSNYLFDLGKQPLASPNVLVEYRLAGLNWPKNTPPTRNWTSLTAQQSGIVMDSVDATQTDFSVLIVGAQQVVDRYLTATITLPDGSKAPIPTNDPNALIISLRPKVRVAFANGIGATREEDIAARAAPRGIAP
jgi:prepilin-type N-terminal cleavage/methylation domain-containing protein